MTIPSYERIMPFENTDTFDGWLCDFLLDGRLVKSFWHRPLMIIPFFVDGAFSLDISIYIKILISFLACLVTW